MKCALASGNMREDTISKGNCIKNNIMLLGVVSTRTFLSTCKIFFFWFWNMTLKTGLDFFCIHKQKLVNFELQQRNQKLESVRLFLCYFLNLNFVLL